jgi:putative lipase involved disintegration of autophagic bodies
VHAGFCGYYRDLVDLGMTDKIASLAGKHPDYRVLLTGHSLGGAAAVSEDIAGAAVTDGWGWLYMYY